MVLFRDLTPVTELLFNLFSLFQSVCLELWSLALAPLEGWGSETCWLLYRAVLQRNSKSEDLYPGNTHAAQHAPIPTSNHCILWLWCVIVQYQSKVTHSIEWESVSKLMTGRISGSVSLLTDTSSLSQWQCVPGTGILLFLCYLSQHHSQWKHWQNSQYSR